MASSSSSTFSSAAANSTNKSHQVFINHRGVDVKKTFARSLYRRLREKGLTAFFDEEEMQGGCEISSQLAAAIRTASVHVTIFSPHYAESEWCLNELLLMLKSNAPIIPVFYRVSPANVRWMQGLYGEALATHEKKRRHDPSTIEEWRNALHQVANNSGFELQKDNDGEELVLKLLDKVVECVLERVPKPDLFVAEYPTGLDDKLKDFEDRVQLTQQQGRKPQILGIVGLGGVGKTTLATAFFNKKKSAYHRSCFLCDVRENKTNRSLHLLQRQLLNSLTGFNKQVNNEREGQGMLIEPLKSCKPIVILDDVDHVDQVKAFLPQSDVLNSESLILITTRDRNVLRSLKVENSSIYSLSGLKEEHSLELFCSHAFSQAFPLPEFNVIQMHDHLTDLGRQVAASSLPRRLLITKKGMHNLSYQSSEITFRGIGMMVPGEYSGQDDDDDVFGVVDTENAVLERSFRSVQILDMEGCHLEPILRKAKPPNLSYLSWNRCPHSSLPSWVSVKNLRILSLYKCDLMALLWNEKSESQTPLQFPISLEEMRVRQCENLRSLIGLERATKLRLLDVSFCSQLEELPSLKTLVSLEDLQAYGCEKLKGIRASAQVTKLRILSVSYCLELEKLPSIETLVSLEQLWAVGCVNLRSISGLAQATNLRKLSVCGCFDLEDVEGIEHCTWLEMLDVSQCHKLVCPVWE